MKSLFSRSVTPPRAAARIEMRSQATDALELASKLGISPVTALVLSARGMSEEGLIKSFLSPTLREGLPSPDKMKNLDRAAEMILNQILDQRRIAVFSDFDVDGISAASQLVPFIKALGGNVIHYTPNRFTEGYGLSKSAAEKLAVSGIKLLITVDCGATNHDAVLHAKKRGLSVIVVDHHQLQGESPADILVNPAQTDCEFNEYKLCAAGIVWFLLIALRKAASVKAEFKDRQIPDPKQFLDLAALGTICDMVPLIGPNRVIASRGIELIKTSSRPGMVALKGVARISGRVSAGGVSFGIGPRINAAGRLDDARHAFELLTTENIDRAQQLAQLIDKLNEQRKTIEDTVKLKCLELIESQIEGANQMAFAVFDHSFHAGVIGIVAQRLVEIFNRPAAVMAPGEMLVGKKSMPVVKGSVRSIKGFHVAEALRELNHLLVHHGGHSEAGGFSIEAEKIGEFREAFSALAGSMLSESQRQRVLYADGEVRFKQIDFKTVNELEKLAPFGVGNPSPLFVTKNVLVESVSPIGDKHLKVTLKDGEFSMTGLCWNFEGNALLRRGEQIQVAHAPEFNTYQGVTTVQLNVKEVWKE